MNVRTYRAATMAQALAEVKQELGRDAVILHARPIRRGGFLGLGRKEAWEVRASASVNVPPRTPKGDYVSEDRPGGGKTPVAAGARPGAGAPEVARDLQDIRHMVQALVQKGGEGDAPVLPGALSAAHQRLADQDVAAPIVAELIAQLRTQLTAGQLDDEAVVLDHLRQLVVGRIPVQPRTAKLPRAQRARVVALIGPTGVGKTTTIAKLAANLKLRRERRVGLITIDSYRIAAVDQLRTYADIIEVPLQPVLSPAELHAAIEAMSDLDVVLVDTAGRSQNNHARLKELRGFLAAAAPDEVHLAVSATANHHCARTLLKQFVPLGANRILLTKVDEAASFGVVLTIASACRCGFSYVTTGQDVPEDIAPADSQLLADWILEGSVDAG